jgi:DNA-directed RNA polymerase specialized sigma24 family protein
VADPGVIADLPAADAAADSAFDPRIKAALMRLPARQRQVVALRLLLDLDTQAIAEVLGIAAGTGTRAPVPAVTRGTCRLRTAASTPPTW